MEPCVNCGNVEPVVPVPSCDCQCNPCPGGDQREIRLIAPTRDEYSDWVNNDPMLPEGVLALVKNRLFEGSVEYIIGDGEHTYSELLGMYRIYAGAPLSRTGAQNHSPLAAEGKSTLDPSWLPAATSNALGAVMVSTTGAAGKVPTPASGSSTLDLSWLPVSGSGAANKIPIAGNNGKLDPSWLPEATSTTLGGVKASTTTAANCVVKADATGSLDGWKDAIIDAITADDGSGGLVTDSDGNLSVDFSQMPTDKFEELLKSLKMLIPLSAALNLYVDTNNSSAGDTIIDGRGTEALPFKTIQAAVNYVTQTYSLGPYNVTIRIKTGTYDEYIRLPKYTATSGTIVLTANDLSAPPTITYTQNKATGVIVISGSKWTLIGLNINKTWESPGDSVYYYPSCITFNGADVSVTISGCHFDCEYSGAAHQTVFRGQVLGLYNGAQVTFYPVEGLQTSFTVDKGNGTIDVLYLGSQAQIQLPGYSFTDDGVSGNIPVTGSASIFLSADNKSSFAVLTGSAHNQVFDNNLTAVKYVLQNGSTCVAPTGGLPGSSSGSADSTTYSWYKELS